MHELQNGFNIFDFSAKVGGTDRILKIYFLWHIIIYFNLRKIKLSKLYLNYLNKAELLLLKLIHLFAREVLLVKKLEIEETKTT